MVNDGRVIVELSPDNMLAKATFVPASGEGRALTLADVQAELTNAGVSGGIDENVIRTQLEICNRQHKICRDILVARGSNGRPAIPQTIIFHPKIQGLGTQFLPPEKLALTDASAAPASNGNTAGAKPQTADDKATIDFREVHGLFIIHEGQVLAATRPAIDGIAGQNVKGEYIPFKTLPPSKMQPGPNTENRDGKIYATKNGRFACKSNTFGVEEVLELTEDVGYKTGNIRFPGSLVLKAGIKDRFKIWVGGNLTATGVIDAYEVFCGGNLDAKMGLIGRGKGLVRVRGNLSASFVEHCEVEVLGNVAFENAALNSHIFTLGTLKTGEKGKIVGGRVQARGGMEVHQLGNGAGVHTEVSVGENYVMHRKLDFARDKYQTITLALQRIAERLKKSSDAGLVHQKERLEEEAGRYQTMVVEILSEINDNEEAVLIVPGTVFPGVVIEVCRVPLTVYNEIKASKFYLHKESGKVIHEAIHAN